MRRKDNGADGGAPADDEPTSDVEEEQLVPAQVSFNDEMAKILTFALSLCTAFSLRDAVVDTFADTPGWNDLVSIPWAICFALCMHAFASAGAMLVIGSTQIPHAMEQTLVLPFGILATQRWDVLVIDISNEICAAWDADPDESYYMCKKDNHSTQWAIGLLVVQVLFAAFLFYLASISTIFAALCVHKREKIPFYLMAAVRIAPIAFSEPVAFSWRYAIGSFVQILYQVDGPTDHWQYFAINIFVTTVLATTAEMFLMHKLKADETRRANSKHLSEKEQKRSLVCWCGIDPCHRMERHVAQQEKFFVHFTAFFLVSLAWLAIPTAVEDIQDRFIYEYMIMWLVLFLVVMLSIAKAAYMAAVHNDMALICAQKREPSSDEPGEHSQAYAMFEKWYTTAASIMLAGLDPALGTSIFLVLTNGTGEIETFWVRVTVIWTFVIVLLALGWARVMYIRRKLHEQITENARVYIMLHAHICPLQRRVHKLHLSKLKRQKSSDGAGVGVTNISADGEATALLPHDLDEDEHDGHWQLETGSSK